MPRAKHSTHPDHVRTTRTEQADGTRMNAAPQAHHATVPQSPPAEPRHAYRPIDDLMLRTDGWLRAVPDSDGKVVWWKWKFTRGNWSGHYVMVRGFAHQNEEAMDILNRKLSNVDLGYDRPTRDAYYDQS